jgi:hypothetical protein
MSRNAPVAFTYDGCYLLVTESQGGTQMRISRLWNAKRVARAVCVVLAAVTLSGCVVVPARPWHPYARYY